MSESPPAATGRAATGRAATGRAATGRAFVTIRLGRATLAAACCVAGNVLPSAVRSWAIVLWGWALRLDPHQEVATVRRALALLECGAPGAWGAFETVLAQVENRRRTSASDLHLARFPGRVLRRWAARLLWGPGALPEDGYRDQTLKRDCARLAEEHLRRSLAAGDVDRGARAAGAWRSLAGNTLEVRWAFAEIAWHREPEAARDLLAPLVEEGAYPSPFDAIAWAERLLEREPDLAGECLRRARLYLPEVARVWTLSARAAWRRREREEALLFCERALAFDPQDLDAFLLRLQVRRGLATIGPWPAAPGNPDAGPRLEVEGPDRLDLGATGRWTCRLEDPGERNGWTLFVLPPAGWGLLPDPAETGFDVDGRAAVAVEARRPDRIRGTAWPLAFVAVGPRGFLVERRAVRVRDPEPGRVLVTVTEDHEIHEERGAMPVDQLRRLLVEKSRFAADLGVPWTHMVETGSTLALPRWAAGHHGGSWRDLEAAVRRHLVDEVRRGNDVQPHLHAFNDPRGGRFPYAVDGDVLETSLDFLLTSAERRGDWASACPPPGHPGGRSRFDRLTSVERSVADLEAVAFRGSPDYRAVLWRSGLLEYGTSAADQAWSAVALRRAGLVAVSDVAKPASPWGAAAQPAFTAGWRDSKSSRPGGPLLQLPIAANLEGDYLMGPRLLKRRARRTVASVRRSGGEARAGIHLFTLITHDKFLNARRGRDELRLDPGTGDWRTIRRHVDAWRAAGATFVTAREGAGAVLADVTWSPVPQLRKARFVAPDPARGEGGEARFRLAVLGRGIPASETWPQHLLVPVPCCLRDHVEAIRIERGDAVEGSVVEDPVVEDHSPGEGAAFWIRRTDDRPVTVTFALKGPLPAALFSAPPEPDA